MEEIMENTIFCQSCGMPLSKDDDFGTNTNGSKNEEYCAYCYKDGKFTRDITMDGMIDICVPFMVEANKDMTEEQARKSMLEWFPTLKRWKTA
jgi:hypothetical protein